MRLISLFILIFLISFHAKGQEIIWKKMVSRVIDTRNEHSRKNYIGRAIFDAIKSGKVSVYDPVYFNFPEKMSDWAMKDIVYGHTEKMTLVDPIDGHEVVKIQSMPPLPDSIHMYRIMEEWTFNKATGKINIQIKYIAPMQDIYGDDAIFRGRRSLFWISFKDFSDALQKSKNAKKQERIFYNSLWQTYFEPFPVKRNNTQWEGYAKSLVDMHEPEDTVEHFLRNENVDTSFCEYIRNEIEIGKMPVWSPDGMPFNKQWTAPELSKYLRQLEIRGRDTTIVTDPIDGHELIKVTEPDICYYVSWYDLLQHWSLNPVTGKTEIDIAGIAPLSGNSHYKRDRNSHPLFWVHYRDVQHILNHIDQYHPTNTFAMHIWNSFFLSDKKPVLVNN